MKYQIKKPNELTENEIKIILNLWEVTEWNSMDSTYFRSFFKDSEFHLLFDSEGEILTLMRLNFDFVLEIANQHYHFAEVVGLVSAHKKKGYGKKLIKYCIDNITERNLESIGFCVSELRPFYDKCEISILHGKAKSIQEKSGSEWIPSDDDDILIFNLSEEKKQLLHQLGSENNAYLLQ